MEFSKHLSSFRVSPTAGDLASSRPGNGSSPPNPKKIRQAITNAQRKDLREHKQALMVENGKYTTKQMVEYFNNKYARILSQPTVSEILSDRFKHLDEEDDLSHPESQKNRTGHWPDLDAALFAWQQQMLKQKSAITSEELKDVAKRLFYQLPQYQHEEPPRFSYAWLEGYKARYNIKKHGHRDGSSATNQAVVAEYERLREDLKNYKRDDIYNMEETALFWKMSPDGTLVSESHASGKVEKARITVNLACNFTGTHKLPLWIVGKAQIPRCFDRSGVQVENFSMVWRHNGKAWMTSGMFEEYLHWFDGQMAGRKVCLLMDELSAATYGLSSPNLVYSEGLANTTILLLPTEATLYVGQPMAQGIILSWKTYYKRRWLTYICDEYDANRDPMRSMTVLQAIRWAIAAWEVEVTATTVQHSWRKSLVLEPKYGPQTESWKARVDEDKQASSSILARMEQQIASLARQQRIRSAVSTTTFISPVEKIVDYKDDPDELFDSIVEVYSTGVVDRDDETDEEDEPEAVIEDGEALELVSRLRLYEEQQVGGERAVISYLNQYERDIRARAEE